MSKDEKFKIIKVTVIKQYYVPMHDEKHTRINHWTMEQVIDDWFRQHNINAYHATRNSHSIGYGDQVLAIEVTDEIITGRELKVEEEEVEERDPCPECNASLKCAPGGGVICPNCSYWFCL